MKPLGEFTITPAVIDAMADCKDQRLLDVMTALVKHLHDFARDVHLTEDEWWRGIQFLARAVHIH